jgi:hypothetical protein
MTARERRPRRGPRPSEGFDPTVPFTSAEAAQQGISRAVLRSNAYLSLLHGVYIASTVTVTPALRSAAPLAVAAPGAWASHASAARIIGAPLPALPGEHISVIDPRERPSRRGVTPHVAPEDSRVRVHRGARISASEQMFVELGEQLTFVDHVVVGDWLVRHNWASLKELRAFAARSSLRGASAARVAVSFVRARVDSPMETRLRMLFVLAGFPEPEVNLSVDLGDGRRRYDLCWPGVKVIAEYDGRHHIEREGQWADDLLRAEDIDDDGWRRRTFIARDIYNTPHLTIERMERLLRSVGLAGMPDRLRDDWRAHFPVKDGYL